MGHAKAGASSSARGVLPAMQTTNRMGGRAPLAESAATVAATMAPWLKPSTPTESHSASLRANESRVVCQPE